ncbi:hypothetical protein B0H17DRAFT_1041909 [Mycena rosella]|uniref:DUF1168-domain-containing protein n=1 Tax=Mycena rosella TaxID=1033263 RepID=A0AAD7E1N9_MYCRO|nr:hypothetical protein B0H17DRAFT_1041909 [Mycena rosella]
MSTAAPPHCPMSNTTPSLSTGAVSTGPVNRHAPTAVERQRTQLDRLLKDPVKPAFVPAPPKEKTIRPPREMMKNVQGSSAGAGSGEFHVYKASRRREYERLKLLEETSQKEADEAAFERKRRDAEETAETKTAKNRAKRQKKKERSKTKGSTTEGGQGESDAPIKKRRLVNGTALVFRKPGEESDGEEDTVEPPPVVGSSTAAEPETPVEMPRILDGPRITIHEDD